MKNKPIIIVAGEPYSIFSEIFFKTLKSKKLLNYNRPLILIGSKKLFEKQMKKLNFFFNLNIISTKNLEKKIDNKKINLINIDFFFKKTFDKISKKSNQYIEKSFKIALDLVNKKKYDLINGPVSKKHFLDKKFLGITEYLAHKTKNKNKELMLIYNEKLSVCPITTHLPIKLVKNKISKKKLYMLSKLFHNFIKKKLNKKPRFAVTGLNPHCETISKVSEETKIIKPAINFLIKKKYNIKGPFPADTLFIKKI